MHARHRYTHIHRQTHTHTHARTQIRTHRHTHTMGNCSCNPPVLLTRCLVSSTSTLAIFKISSLLAAKLLFTPSSGLGAQAIANMAVVSKSPTMPLMVDMASVQTCIPLLAALSIATTYDSCNELLNKINFYMYYSSLNLSSQNFRGHSSNL